jgi:hypothetical protein
MFARVKAWRAERRCKDDAIRRAVQEFGKRRGFAPMGAHVLRTESQETIVRVMYLTDHIPPDRAWFAVPKINGVIRELTFTDVARFESPWR